MENERLPPELIDPDSEEAKPFFLNASTPPTDSETPVIPDEISNHVHSGHLSEISDPESTVNGLPDHVLDPKVGLAATGTFKRGHSRQQSLGTTKTSPSTRRRSVENTISLIKEAVELEPDEK